MKPAEKKDTHHHQQQQQQLSWAVEEFYLCGHWNIIITATKSFNFTVSNSTFVYK